MKLKEIGDFEALQGRVESFHLELGGLAKKSPNDALNKFKLSMTNALLEELNRFLSKSDRPIKGFEQFEESSMPSNSDVLIVLSQYLSALEKLRSDNVFMFRGFWYWRAEDEDTERPTVRTFAPKKLKLD